jgi:hypothetical protein
VTLTFFWQRTFLFFGTAFALAACSTGPQITRTQDLSESADAPYQNILIIALFPEFDTRRRLEKAVVEELTDLGTEAVASTSLMDSNTPMTRQTFLKMIESLDVDAALVTHPLDIESKTAVKDSSPEATYNVGPTYYFNVWEVELTEYVEPQNVVVEGSYVLATQFFSVLNREAVWAIESKADVVEHSCAGCDYMVFVNEAEAIVKHLSNDGLIAQ